MKLFFAIVAFVSCVSLSSAQVVTWFGGLCPEVTPMENFDITAYMGKWYELEKYPNLFQNGDCATAEYTLQDDGTVQVNNTELRSNGVGGSGIGQARRDPDRNMTSQLEVRFQDWQPWGNYWVLDTDYDQYTVVWSCTSAIIVRFELLWILGRDRSLSPSTWSNITQMLNMEFGNAEFGISEAGRIQYGETVETVETKQTSQTCLNFHDHPDIPATASSVPDNSVPDNSGPGTPASLTQNFCESNPCKNGGTCKESEDNDFECSCLQTFRGKMCEEELFCCEDGNECIEIERHCDELYDCDDKSDESGAICQNRKRSQTQKIPKVAPGM